MVQSRHTMSDEMPITFCITQGSILGSLMFTMYINDLHSTAIKSPTSHVIVFHENSPFYGIY